jgi:hypothetical protein
MIMNIYIVILVALFLGILFSGYPIRHDLIKKFKSDSDVIWYYITHPKAILRDF